MKGEQLYEEILNETADSIETINKNLFTCGTYQLIENNDEKSSSNRIGSLILYEMFDGTNEVSKLHVVPTNAILDMKWYQNNASSNNVLSLADSCGNALFFELDEDNKKLIKKHEKVIDKNSLCLSTDWVHAAKPDDVLYSLSSGNLVHYRYSTDTIINIWEAHSLEAWIIANDMHNTNTVYSGADDCLLKIWDLRTLSKPCSVKKHLMGVCSIQSHPCHEHYFAVGSYEETLCIWDNRNLKSSISTTETGGGVWRVKWHPNYTNYLLTASMHDGFKIVEFTESYTKSDIVLSYKSHESLAYGTDWLVDKSHDDNGVLGDSNSIINCNIASCSFYDKKMTVWKIVE